MEFNAERSDIKSIKNGVPQGSILGPLLFLIYINDLPNASHVFDCLMYADDTTLFCCLEDIKSINKQDVINEQLQRIHNWLTANGLKLNTTKSKYIMFRKQNKNIPLFNIHINNVNIESVQNFNFLGLHLSSDMTWNFHTNEVSKKISRNIGILKKLQLIVPNNILLTIYNTLILPHINYCLLSWGSKPDKIFQLQKRAVRAISGANSKSHTEPLCKFYNILKVDDIFTYKLLTFYWKAKQAQLPKYLSKFLPELSEGANKYAIRHPRLQPPVHKHEYIKGTCRYQLAILLNEISVSDNSLGQLKIITTNVQIMTLFGLKRIVKSCLVQNYSYYCAIPNCYVCQLYVN